MPGAPEAAEEAEEVVDWMGLNRHSATPERGDGMGGVGMEMGFRVRV